MPYSRVKTCSEWTKLITAGVSSLGTQNALASGAWRLAPYSAERIRRMESRSLADAGREAGRCPVWGRDPRS